MYFEIYSKGKLLKRGTEILNTLSWDSELMYVPETELVLPIDYLQYISGREEVKIYVNNKVFWGIIRDIEVDKATETVTVFVPHIISEWQNRQISVNNAISNKRLNIVYQGDDVKKSGAEAITARGATKTLTHAKSLTSSDLIKYASAWNTTNGDVVPVTSAVILDDKGKEVKITEEGTYKVKYSTANGTSITVDLQVVKDKEKPSYDVLPDPTVADNLGDIYSDSSFTYPGWQIDISEDASEEMIDYVYSRQNKLEALTQTMELTEDLWWRVGWQNEKRVEISKFGEQKPYIFSVKPSGANNIRIIGEPNIDYDFENVVNVATVYSDKTDGGMSSLTLREVYNDKSLQRAKFPVVILHEGVNNERDYKRYIDTKLKKIAPNNETEYAIIDEESIALESGTLVEGTFSFNDYSPFEVNSKIISDRKRVRAAKTVYNAVVRKLKQVRRSYDITIRTEEIPPDLLVGDKVRLIYDNSVWNIEACSSYWKKILSYDDWFYVTKISYDIDGNGTEINTLTLTKWLKIDRDTI